MARGTAAAVTAAALLGAAACGSSDTASNAALTVWAPGMSSSIEQDQQIWQEITDAYEQETGTAVDVEVIAFSDLLNRITVGATSGQLADVVIAGSTWSPSLSATGAFTPLTEDDIDNIGGRDAFLGTLWENAGLPDEDPIGVPVAALSYGLFYNKQLLADAGIEPPQTWEELVDAAAALTKDTTGDGTPDQWGLTLDGAFIPPNAHWAFILSQQEGGDFFDSDGNPTFATDENVRGVQRYIDLMASGAVNPSNAEFNDPFQATQSFAAGDAAMILQQTYARGVIEQAGMPQDAYGVVPAPVIDPLPEGGEPVLTHIAAVNASVSAETENREGAMDFLRHFTSRDVLVQYTAAIGWLPTRPDAFDAEEFSDPNVQVFRDIIDRGAAPMPRVPEESQMETLVGGAVQQLFAQAATGTPVTENDVREALEAAQQQLGPGA
jgi:multiple sugar transport system substrate-binding protein